jgi:hypothetical protein
MKYSKVADAGPSNTTTGRIGTETLYSRGADSSHVQTGSVAAAAIEEATATGFCRNQALIGSKEPISKLVGCIFYHSVE